MKKINELLGIIKKDRYKRIMAELILGTLLFNVNFIIGAIFLLIIVAEILSASNEDCLFTFIFLSFFDEVLQIKQLGGSISRIVMAVIFVKLLINIIVNKYKPNKYQIGILIFFFISLIVSIINLKRINTEVIMILSNIIIFVLFSMAIKLKTKDETEQFIRKLLLTIVLAVLNSTIYGIINNNVIKEIEGDKIAIRFKGTYEPNFMCMYINLAFLSIISIKDTIKPKILYYIGAAILITANVLTVSITGLITLLTSLIIYFIIQRKSFKEEIKDFAIIIILFILCISSIRLVNSINSKIELKKQTVLKEQTQYTSNNELNNVATMQNQTENDNKVNETLNNTQNSNEAITNTNKDAVSSGLNVRLSFLTNILKNGDLDRFSSGRIPLFTLFVEASFNRPIFNILLGNDPTTKMLFSKYFYKAKYSHNSYVDILYNFGVIGFLAMMIYIFNITKNNIFLGSNINENKYKNAIKLIRIMLLIYSITLSLYTKRMVLVFFLL